jgi:hypothetical protein
MLNCAVATYNRIDFAHGADFLAAQFTNTRKVDGANAKVAELQSLDHFPSATFSVDKGGSDLDHFFIYLPIPVLVGLDHQQLPGAGVGRLDLKGITAKLMKS